MKFSFSTLGCPTWSFGEIVASAKDLGYNGIELRGIENELYMPISRPFLAGRIEATKEMLKQKGIEIPCLTSGALLSSPKCTEEIEDYIDLARVLNVPYIRVLADADPEPSKDLDENQVIHSLKTCSLAAEKAGVCLLVETNGVYADSEKMLSLIQTVNSKAVNVLWDINHPYRYFNEQPMDTFNKLKPYIKHVHIKDSKMVNGKTKYCMVGEGDLPIQDFVNELKNGGYTGYISLEWVKRWNTDLQEPGIVFVHFISTIKYML